MAQKITLNELKNLVKNIVNEDLGWRGDEESDFLSKVERENPDLHVRFINMVKRKGLEFAKSEYQQFDPEFIKQQAKDQKKQITSQNRKEKLKELKDLIPSKQEIKDCIEEAFLTPEFRKLSQKLIIPQVVTDNLEYKIISHTMNNIDIEYFCPSYLQFNSKEEFINYRKNIGLDDSVSDDISKAKEVGKKIRKYKEYEKKFGSFMGFEDDYFGDSSTYVLRLKSNLSIRLGIFKRENIMPSSDFKTSFEFDTFKYTIGVDSNFEVLNNKNLKSLLNKKSDIPLTFANEKEKVIELIKKSLMELESKLSN